MTSVREIIFSWDASEGDYMPMGDWEITCPCDKSEGDYMPMGD